MKTDRLVFVTMYRTEAENIKRIINRNWDIMRVGKTLGQIFPEPPFISFSSVDVLLYKINRYMVRAPTNVTVNTPAMSCK